MNTVTARRPMQGLPAAALCVLCGAALALAYPRFDIGILAWIAPVPWIVITARRSPARAFGLSWAFGFGFFGLLLVWVHGVLSHYTTLPLALSLPIWILLIGYLSLYPAAYGWMIAALVRRWGTASLLMTPVLWVGLEEGRGFLIGGFPWGLAGQSHAGGLALWQAASLGGVALVSILVACVWSALAFLALRFTTRAWPRQPSRTATLTALVMIALVAIVIVLGGARLRRHPPVHTIDPLADGVLVARLAGSHPPVFGVALVQGGFGSDLDETQARQALHDYLDLSRRVLPFSPSVIVWPESNAPYMIDGSPGYLDVIRDLSRRANARVLLGSVAGDARAGLRNSAYLIDPGGVEARYDKRRLVQYGEYVPLKGLFPFIRKFVPEAGDFVAGQEVGVLRVGDRSLGVAICYEMIFPEEILLQVRHGANLLVNITNDSWFPGAGPWQHAEFARMRAIETGLWTVRGASTGRTLLIDPWGRISAALPLGGPGVLMAQVPPARSASPSKSTLYVTSGPWVSRSCVTITALTLAFLVVGNIIDRRRRTASPPSR